MDKKYYIHTIDTFTDKEVTVEVSKLLYETIKKSQRKERYFCEDLKTEIIQVEQENQIIMINKSRDDSFERLAQDVFKEFSDGYSLEDDCKNKISLTDALYQLEQTEHEMI